MSTHPYALPSHIVGKGETVGMALVRLMPLAAFELPSVVGREESVGLGRRVGNLGQTQTVCHSHRLLIHTRTTNDVDIFVFADTR